MNLFLFVLSAMITSGSFAQELARVGEKTITLQEFNKKYSELAPFYQNKSPSKQTVLNDLIKRELGIQEAKKSGIEKDPQVIEKMNTVLYQSYLEKTLGSEFEKINPTTDELKSYYQANPEIRVSHIFVSVPSNASKETEAAALSKIKTIKDRELKSGKSFAEIAQKFSEGVAAPLGGDIDYQTKDKLDPTFYAAAKSLSVGSVSEVVRTSYGYHLIKLTAIRPWSDVNRQVIRQVYVNEKKQTLFEDHMKKVWDKSKVTINNALLN
jgi:parvulin-like peptidyl-prolyl isomerase